VRGWGLEEKLQTLKVRTTGRDFEGCTGGAMEGALFALVGGGESANRFTRTITIEVYLPATGKEGEQRRYQLGARALSTPV